MKNLVLILFACQLFSCQKESKVTIEDKKDINNSNITKIEEIIKKQLAYGAAQYFQEAGVEMPKPEFSIDELNEVSLVTNDILKKNGYIQISDEDFKSKIKEIFNRILEMNSNNNIIYLNYFDRCNKNIIKYPNNGTDYNGTYIIKNQKMITDFYYLPELVDYEKKYPQLHEAELKSIDTYKDKDGDEIKIEKWKNLEDLKNTRYNNTQKIVNRNKYLFNDNKASLAWLKSNDEYFLESLVKIFGYTKDKDLLEWVMKRNESKANDFVNQFLFVRNCKGELEIREGILKYIEDNTTEDEKTQNYVNAIAAYDVNDKNNNWDEKEIIKIRAYIANTYDFLFMKYKNIGNTNIGRFSYLGLIFYNSNKENSKDWQQIEENFKQNNYYNLPHLKNASSFALEFESGASY
ncbi:hypothetical protein QWZ06_04800 [Chryseobacterium tructae]|uniref:Uncharacterized protein n=1 Tax=Chryseobacterium tructae TaxID=1037380 RepID=A0ABV7XUB6_9FLAO|nr:hypothetical protein [Chryseobacterium tructae]MDN3691617.1 hypothetical protein [Chryseobacterium tructae]